MQKVASFIHGGVSVLNRKAIYQDLIINKGTIRLFYCGPEMILNNLVLQHALKEAAKAGRFNLIVFDEAHLIIEWGSFREDYSQLGLLRQQLFPGVPIFVTTATITPEGRRQVKKCLGMTHGCKEFVMNANRTNLRYEVRRKHMDVVVHVSSFIKNEECPDAKGIVYCATIADCIKLARGLNIENIQAAAYHGKLSTTERAKIHDL